FSLLYKNEQFSGVEVDLVLLGPDHNLLLCEVKSLSCESFVNSRVKQSQRSRLERAARHIEGRFGKKVELVYVFVSKSSIQIYDNLGEPWSSQSVAGSVSAWISQ
ncbi:MAG: hypothetical protein AAF202_11575, partial [Pseudomonadota bacterium]